MVTEHMTLTTIRDADFWASDILDGSEHTNADHSKLSDWIWNNKPKIGCTMNEHPIIDMNTEKMFELLES